MNAATHAAEIDSAVEAAIARHRDRPGALLPLLHDVQDAVGYVPPEAVGPIARALNLSRAEVHGVVTFYHHFRDKPAGRHVLRICQAESCQSMGSAELTAHARRVLGCGLHETTADGAFTLEPTYCLGLCAMSPAASLDADVFARLTPHKLERVLAAARREDVAEQNPGPDAR
jgi:formate dehydrogenase subunit gamma